MARLHRSPRIEWPVMALSLCVSSGRDIRGLTDCLWRGARRRESVGTRMWRSAMKRRRVAFSLAVVASALVSSARSRRPSRAPSSSCSPARAARRVRRPTSLPANSRTIPRSIVMSLADRLLGLSRLEGHARAARSRQPPARLFAQRAAIARSTRRRRSSTASRMCSAATRARSNRRSRQTHKQPGTLTLPVTLSVAGDKISVSVPAAKASPRRARSGFARSPGRAGRDRPRREHRPHAHLPQRGAALGEARRLDRRGAHLHGAGQATSPASAATRLRWWCRPAPRKRPASMLGAAVTALH